MTRTVRATVPGYKNSFVRQEGDSGMSQRSLSSRSVEVLARPWSLTVILTSSVAA